MKLENLPSEFVKALPVLEKIQAHGFEAYFVGGSVRDALLQRSIHDVDIATSAYPAETKAIFPHTIDVGIDHGTVLVLAGQSEAEHYEITTFRTESTYTDYRRPDSVDFVRELSEDLKRRDFTINAFAMDTEGEIIDLFDGLSDLAGSRLRAVGIATERFNEDALRIMRAMRFAATLNFNVEEETFKAMQARAHLLSKISIERIFIELDKLLLAKDWKKGLEILLESEAYTFLPDLQEKAIHALIQTLNSGFTFANSAQAWAALLVHSDQINVKTFLKKWKVSNDFIKYVHDLTEAYKLESWSLESIYRYGLEKALLVDQLKIAAGQDVDCEQAYIYDAKLQIHSKSELAVTGNDIIQTFNIKPGPILGKLLHQIEEQVVNNQLKNDRNKILIYIKEIL
ncbi:CCA tRNA nucleotidyltransferase [Lactococcus formosensis]|jgi:tRNA nucleotidyltransferase (CCA-adding enzyme)|uniref:CCA-adding enzyme n=1 Tax=Lactococcus formosensis TaxID=1281486 RepID=A0A9Q8Y082_9LACT|nr:CCA tRNA nucleotidyltransferase [Lactococcus formosensis]MDG6111001.1 CCA tRNA nucleotidyltransferase [Lactococcus formosensis]MDG6117391.1 CCA tRNA nucleotidyltransferase [Lactococcus formosensis]MDG6132848.1 CCA tRNA nucleotidyltransferase [Lactococcus formosensis]MDG6134843.1 CCA tRNA nucleotidyltransferase [Lactococcus formosensis]MDG6137854.1 CCA tRNA nucleotidyltransferase [Lactococcus formosensis]